MTALAVSAAAGLCGVVLAGAAAGLLALLRVRSLAAAEQRAGLARLDQESALAELRKRVEALAARLEGIREIRAVSHSTAASVPKSGMNLSRRSQALRLYRRGEPAARIAAELGVPVQEVELLIKVHEIVLSTV